MLYLVHRFILHFEGRLINLIFNLNLMDQQYLYFKSFSLFQLDFQKILHNFGLLFHLDSYYQMHLIFLFLDFF
jgi:hypothetical protein